MTIYNAFGWLAVGMSTVGIINDFSALTKTDIMTCLELAADQKKRLCFTRLMPTETNY